MEDLQFLFSNDGSSIITSNQSAADRYDNNGYDRSASFFDSYSGRGSKLARGFINKATGEVQYALSSSDASEYKERGYSRIGGSFSVSLRPRDGLKPIYELEKDGLISYVPSPLRKSYTKNGYANNGLAWYSPINTGNVRISNANVSSGDQPSAIDEVTGSLVFNYEVDNLHSSQFINTINTLSFRVLIESVDGSVYSQNLPDIDIPHTSDDLSGTISTDFIGNTGLPLQDIASINIAGVAKYGMSKTAKTDISPSMLLGPSPTSDQLDAGYTFFRGNSLRLYGDGLSQTSRSSATPMKGLSPRYFQLSLGYENESFINMSFAGYPLQSLTCFSCTFKGNDFSHADMSGFYSVTDEEKGDETPKYGRDNPNKFNGMTTLTPTYRGDTLFQTSADGNPRADSLWYVGDFTGALMNEWEFKIKYDYLQLQGYASVISIENLSTGGQNVQLEHLDSATMGIGPTPLSGTTRFMKSYGYRQKRFYDQGLFDVEGRVSYNGYTYDFGARNPATSPARFYLKGEKDVFIEMSDDGSSAFLKWKYEGSELVYGNKIWKLEVINWNPPNQSGSPESEILPAYNLK